MNKPFTFEALGTRWWLEVFDELSTERSAVIFDDCAAFVHSFEAKYSRFANHSLITELNRQRVLTKPTAELVDLLTLGKRLYIKTNTHFNFLTGHIQEARGYDAAYSFQVAEQIPEPGNPVTDLEITGDAVTLHSNANVDLGGFGKGYCIDLLATHLKQKHGLRYFLINGGGDIFATSDHNTPLTIQLEDPTKATKSSIGTTELHNQAFAASSSLKRTWKSSDKHYSHIIGDSKQAVYIKAEQAVIADAFATAALIMPGTEFKTLVEAEKLNVLYQA